MRSTVDHDAAPPAQREAFSNPHRNGDVTHPRVLLVDDEADILTGMADTLAAAAFRSVPTGTLAQAKNALATERFDLVVTDLYLGDDALGTEIANLAQAQRPPVPVILLTGRPSVSNAQDAIRSCVAELLVKPVAPHELVAACRRTLERQEIRQRAEQLAAQNRVLAGVLPRAIEAKDPTTRGHSDRVVQYAETLARRCGVDEADRQALRLASQLHDVGKIGIPEAILCKEGPLTADEREVIKRHPQMGYEILEPLEGSENVRRWVFEHHERWDGRGYPRGLAGEDVALPGRILILAEVYDALAEARSYKRAWDVQKIVDLFRAEAGHHFDPDLSRMVADGLETQGKRFFAPSGMLF
ncbi:MAG: HD domain-containing phosphohydrolase [Planctomycetota bacterium]